MKWAALIVDQELGQENVVLQLELLRNHPGRQQRLKSSDITRTRDERLGQRGGSVRFGRRLEAVAHTITPDDRDEALSHRPSTFSRLGRAVFDSGGLFPC